MDKNAIKKFAIWARRELIERVSQRAAIYGITAVNHGDPAAESVNGRLLTASEKNQRKTLISSVNEKGFEQVIEEVAYTWFNRFAALRFMEVNGYLPSHIRVFTNEAGEFKPQILTEAIHLDLPGLNMDKVYELENASKTEELFKYLLVVQCNALNRILPGMFQRIDDYTELLLPDNLLREGSVIEKLVIQGLSDSIPESDWTDQVQIIGWLYQYYNTEPKDKVFSDLKKNIKITKEKIPAATQLFTPDWIVHYMVENSLGRLWLEGHPNDSLKSEWKYYLDEAEQEPEVQEQLENIRKEYTGLKPEEIKVIDPCSGSGHILCVLFDVLVRIYEDFGHTAREAVTSIIKNNIWGLDIDERAAQLSYFAVMMKARQYDRRFLTRKDADGNPDIPQPHVYAIEESNGIKPEALNELGHNLTQEEREEALSQINKLLEEMHDAKEYGSLTNVSVHDWNLLRQFTDLTTDNGLTPINMHGVEDASRKLQKLISIGEALAQKYEVVVTNPPYMGGAGMSSKLAVWVKDNYPDSKSDLFAVFIERIKHMVLKNGFQSMITQHAWMFLSSYEKLRLKLQSIDTCNMIHLGARAFEEIGGEVVQTTSFVFRNSNITRFVGNYVRLIESPSQKEKEEMFLCGVNRFYALKSNFTKIPGSPVAYWASDTVRNAFKYSSLYSHSASPSQNITGNNSKFVRKFWEISKEKVGCKDQWIFYCKGGGYRKWWGNLTDIVNWTPSARYVYQNGDGEHASQIINKEYWYKKGITWGLITSNVPSFRVMPDGATYDKGGSTIIVDEDVFKFSLGLLNSNVYLTIVSMLNPTLNYQVKDVRSMPLILKCISDINTLVETNIIDSKNDWDAFETSWNFLRHPLLKIKETLLIKMHSNLGLKNVLIVLIE